MYSTLENIVDCLKKIWIEISSAPVILLFGAVTKSLEHFKNWIIKKLKEIGIPIGDEFNPKDASQYQFIMYSIISNSPSVYTNPFIPFAISIGNGIYTKLIVRRSIYSKPSKFL